MNINGTHYRSIRALPNGDAEVIDQTKLPFEFSTRVLSSMDAAAAAIRDMAVRGAPLIGAAAAYGIALAMRADPSDASLKHALKTLQATRPTAVNLAWALRRMEMPLRGLAESARYRRAALEAQRICDEDVAVCAAIGGHGLGLIREAAERKQARVNILTHCNAGWLATVDHGTALAPIYRAHDEGVAVHVWVDETRPRNQGAALTAYELGAHGVPYTIISDNAGGHLMQRGEVDFCIVGTDRTTADGDVANKIGTYLKALAARDNSVPFYVALPASTIDWSITDGIRDIPIEERSEREVTHIAGLTEGGNVRTIRIAAPGSNAANPAFDVTPARLVTAFITERGIAPASREGLLGLFPEKR